MKKIKILYFVDRLAQGGIQTFIAENLKYIDKTKFQIDILTLDDGKIYGLEDEIKKMGVCIYKLNGIWIKNIFDYHLYVQKVDEFFSYHKDYDVVHLHSSSKNFYILKSAKKYRIPIRISHSHNINFQTNNIGKIIIGNIFKKLLYRYSTDFLACSEIAGQWLFGKKTVKEGKVKIIRNAVDLSKFKYNVNKREEIRKKYNLENKIVIGHVGRFSKQKNHNFLIDIFNELYKIDNKYVLMLIGEGEEQNKIKNKVKMLGVLENVLFLGKKNDVNEYMNAMDLFLFPSKFEGLGIVLIEAQAMGLKCITSKNVVPEEANITKTVEYISLSNEAQDWAKRILELSYERNDTHKIIKNKGYDIVDTICELEKYYICKCRQIGDENEKNKNC